MWGLGSFGVSGDEVLRPRIWGLRARGSRGLAIRALGLGFRDEDFHSGGLHDGRQLKGADHLKCAQSI